MKRTPLYAVHRRSGARLVEFAGFEMPVQYEGILAEHRAVRSSAGLFDVSHMGRFLLRGDGALPLLQWTTANDVSRLAPGQAQYTLLTNPQGGVKDDLIVYRLRDEEYLAVVNAANREKDWEWLKEHASPQTEMVDWSEETCLLAWQGPRAAAILQELVPVNLDRTASFRHVQTEVKGVPARLLRTGYSGEDGFEIVCAAEDGEAIWDLLLAQGAARGAKPAGLGARDTLRLEMGYCLYGHELTEATNPVAAGLGWVVKLDKPGGFVGREAISEAKRNGPAQKLVGLVLDKGGIARQGCDVRRDGARVGEVTSGSHSPSLDVPIALAYLERGAAEAGSQVSVIVRDRPQRARVQKPRFYEPSRS